MAMTDEDLKRYTNGLEKKARVWRAELALNPFDVNAMSNLTKIDIMFVEALNRYLNQWNHLI